MLTGKRKTQIGTILLLAFILATVAVIWGYSLEPPDQSAQTSQFIMDRVVKVVLGPVVGETHITHFLVRKMGHFTEFFILGTEILLLLIVHRRIRYHWVLHALTVGLLVAAADETIQIFSGRGSCLPDVWLDFAGYCTGVGICLLIYSGVRRKLRRRTQKIQTQ